MRTVGGDYAIFRLKLQVGYSLICLLTLRFL